MSRDVTIVLKVDNQFSAPLEQFNSEIGQVSDGTNELAGATRQADDSFSGLAAGITTGIVAYAGWKGLNAVGDMINLGQKVDVTTQGFGELTQHIGGSVSVLQQLKEATQFATTDTDLMNEANKLLSLNLVNNADDLSHLIGVADDLAGVFGVDGKTGVDAFTKALETGRANTLVRFGIDLDAVKKRTEELKATMDDKAAFRMALLEQADKTLERFGDAANAAQTPIDRLKTSVTNLSDAIQRNISIGASGALGIIEISTGKYPGQAEAKAKAADDARNAAADFARQNFGDMTQYLDMAGVSKASDSFVSQLMFTTAEAIKNNPDLDVSKFIADKLAQGWAAGEHVAPTDVKGYVDSFNMVYSVANAEIAATIDNQQGELRKKLYANLLAGDSGREFTPGYDLGAHLLASYNAQPDDKLASMQQQAEAQALAAQRHSAINGINSSVTGAFGSMGYDTSVTDPSLFQQKLDPSYMKSLVPDYMEQSDADAVTRDLRTAQDEFAKLQDMSKQKLIGDDQLENAKNMVDNLSAMSDQAQKAADAFKNLSLSSALGQQNGGMKGEMTDMVIQNMKDKGYGKTAIANMQEQLDLSSGRETSASEEMKQKIVPMIAKLSAKQAATALANLDAFLKEATLQGMSEDQIAAMMPAAAGVDVTGHSRKSTPEEVANQQKAWEAAHKKNKKGQWVDKHGKPTSFTADMTQGYNTVSGGYDFSDEMSNFMDSQTMTTSSGSAAFGDVSGSMEGLGGEKGGAGGKGGGMKSTIMATDFKSISKDAISVDKSTANIETSTTKAAAAATTISNAIRSIPDHKKIVLEFTADDPQGLVSLAKSLLGGSTSFKDLQRDNGQAGHTDGGGV